MSSFSDYPFKPALVKAIDALGFDSPTPIQQQAFTHLLESSQDLIAMAQTGTGKTAAFSLPILNAIDIDLAHPQAIILSPTRELGLQIHQQLEAFAKYLPGLNALAVYGGASMEKQIQALKKGVQIVVGTPGRTLDLIKRKKLDISKVQWVVLDEADEMLGMGFQDDMDAILETTPKTKQTLLFSATVPPEIKQLSKRYMHKPAQIRVSPSEVISSSNVTHGFYLVAAKERYDALKRIVDNSPEIYGMIFCRTRRETQEVAEKLMQQGYSADTLHGDLNQNQRDQVMRKFRQKQIQILVATDVAARGIDVTELTHVINYNLPDDDEVYVHRSGRTGRAGNNGKCVSIINNKDMRRIRFIEKKVGKIEKLKVPNAQEICQGQLLFRLDRIANEAIDEKAIAPYMQAANECLGELTKEQLVERLVSRELTRFVQFYQGARDLNVTERAETRSRNSNSNSNGQRLFINIGKKQKLDPKALLGFINKQARNKDIDIGNIDIHDTFSFFDVPVDYAQNMLDALNGSQFQDRKVSVELSQQAKSSSPRKNRAKPKSSSSRVKAKAKPKARAKRAER